MPAGKTACPFWDAVPHLGVSPSSPTVWYKLSAQPSRGLPLSESFPPLFCICPAAIIGKYPQGKTERTCQSLSRVRLFVTPQTVAHQAPLSMGILQARILSGLHALLQGIFPGSLLSEPPGINMKLTSVCFLSWYQCPSSMAYNCLLPKAFHKLLLCFVQSFFFLRLIYLFTAVLGLCCRVRAFSSCSKRTSHCSGFSCCRAHTSGRAGSAVAVRGFLSTCGEWAQLL